MKGEFRLSVQTSGWSRFAAVEVDVVPADRDGVTLAADSVADILGQSAVVGARQALRTLPGTNHVTITMMRTSPVDTGVGDVFEATLRAVWSAYGMPDHDTSLRDPWLVDQLFRELHGRDLLAVTESRYRLDGVRDGETDSLVDVWLHFAHTPPIQLEVRFEDLVVSRQSPYPSSELGTRGELRVGPAQLPDLLATALGGRLLSSAAVAGANTSAGSAGVILLALTTARVVLAATNDRLLLLNDPSPQTLTDLGIPPDLGL